MAVYRDIDSDVRINGSLALPTGSLTIGGINIINEINSKVDNTITLSAGTGLSGGGNLTANRTLSVSFGTTAGTVSEGNHVHTFASLTSKPTTLSGYGITDASTSTHVHTFASLTSKPTTLLGYGITDASDSAHTHAFINLTGRPTTVAGYGITDAVLISDVVTVATASKILKLDDNSKLPASITGNADGNAATSTKLATARTISITGDGTSSASFDGSANAALALTLANSGATAGTYTKVTIDTKGRVTLGASLVEADVPSLNWSKVSLGRPTTLAGYGITDASISTHTHTFASLTSRPTTLLGYGITDAAPLVHTHVWADIISGKPTTLAGYGITDAASSTHNHDAAYSKRGSKNESVAALDKRTWTPTDISGTAKEVVFTFTSLNNNNAAPYADAIAMSTYTDASAGGNSMLLFDKEGAGMYHRYGAWNGADWLWTKKLAYDQDKVDKTTSIVAGAGLNGGGDLTINRTFAVDFGTVAGTVAEGNHVHTTAQITGLDTALSNKSDLSHTHTFASLTSKPTTLAGYGITDASLSTHVHTFASLTSKPTTLVGYGITDAATATHNHNTTYLGITAKAEDSDKLNGQLASFYTASSAFTAHTGDTSIHKSWGNWATSGGGVDLTVNSKRALVHVAASNKLMINYAGDFTGGVEIAGPLTTGGFAIWHAGNLNTSDFVSTSTAATLAGNLTVKGRIWAGDASAAGSLVIKDSANQNAIHLGGTAALSNVKAFVSDTGSAKFNSSVQVGSLIVDSTALVQKLNAEFVGGSKETEFVRTYSIRDNRGYGIHSGMEVVQKSPTPDMTVQVKPGIAYTDSGRRFEWLSDAVIPVAQASANYDRIDIVFIYGKVDGANEGTIGLIKGLADRVTPIPPTVSLPVGSIVLAYVYVKANIGTITDGTSGTFDAIDNAVKKMASVRLAEGISYTINEPVYTGSDIYEKGEKLEDKYAEVAKPNTFTGNQDINGRVKVQSTGSLNGVPGSANYYLRVTDGTNILAIDPDEIVTTGAMNLTAGSTMILSAGAGNAIISMNGRMKASQNATTLTIPAGQTSVTWTHNYGATTYAVNPVSNSFERHVRWTSKMANTIVIEIDDISSQDILVDCTLIGY